MEFYLHQFSVVVQKIHIYGAILYKFSINNKKNMLELPLLMVLFNA